MVIHYLFVKYNIQFSHGIRAPDLGGPCFHCGWTLTAVIVVTFSFFVFIAIYCEFPPLMWSLWDSGKHYSSWVTVQHKSLFTTRNFHSDHTFHRDILFIALVLKFIIKKIFWIGCVSCQSEHIGSFLLLFFAYLFSLVRHQ